MTTGLGSIFCSPFLVIFFAIPFLQFRTLTLWRWKMKSSAIFLSLFLVVSWVQNFSNLEIFPSVPKIFEILVFRFVLTVRAYLITYFMKITLFIVLFMQNSDPLEFWSYFLPFRRYRRKKLIFLTVRDHSARLFLLIFYFFRKLWCMAVL